MKKIVSSRGTAQPIRSLPSKFERIAIGKGALHCENPRNFTKWLTNKSTTLTNTSMNSMSTGLCLALSHISCKND